MSFLEFYTLLFNAPIKLVKRSYQTGRRNAAAKLFAVKANTPDVQAKKAAAGKYCQYASEYTTEHGGKPWKYGLVPHDAITRTNSLAFLVGRFVDSHK